MTYTLIMDLTKRVNLSTWICHVMSASINKCIH